MIPTGSGLPNTRPDSPVPAMESMVLGIEPKANDFENSVADNDTTTKGTHESENPKPLPKPAIVPRPTPMPPNEPLMPTRQSTRTMKPNQRFQNLTRTSMLSTTIRESFLRCFLFSSHESVLPREPPSEREHAPFGKIFDFDTDSLSSAESSRLNYMWNIDQENELRNPEPDDQVWRCIKIQKHRLVLSKGKRYILVKAEWVSGDTSWVQIKAMALHDPYVLIQYARQHSLIKHKDWKWVTNIVKNKDQIRDVVCNHNAQVQRGAKYKFGVEIPKNVRHALELDALNGDDAWHSAIDTELTQCPMPGVPVHRDYWV